MSVPESHNVSSPGERWLDMKAASRIELLQGIMQGLNQGLRYCAGEISFALSTRLSDDLSSDNRLTIDSLIQQTRMWSKSSVTVFKYSKTLAEYAAIITEFYRNYPQYRSLSPAYLMIYIDDQHGMGPDELYALHTHSLQGFKL